MILPSVIRKLLKRKVVLPIAILLSSLFVIINITTIAEQVLPRLYINFTSSEPVGIYASVSNHSVEKGRLVLVTLTDQDPVISQLSSLKPGRPLLKQVGALAGDRVCVKQSHLYINSIRIARVFRKSSLNEKLPRIRGCVEIRDNSFLPLSLHSRYSLDGRYFGPQKLSSILSQVEPVLVF